MVGKRRLYESLWNSPSRPEGGELAPAEDVIAHHDRDERAGAGSERARDSGNVRLTGVRVLVVDDTPSTLQVITDILEFSGATVVAVDSATKALGALERDRPAVLISDLEMPGNGGYWLIGQVRQLPPERGGATPAAALTGLNGPQHRASALRAGFQYHIEKPVSALTLVDIVATLALNA